MRPSSGRRRPQYSPADRSCGAARRGALRSAAARCARESARRRRPPCRTHRARCRSRRMGTAAWSTMSPASALLHHVVQRRAGFGGAAQHRPVDRRAAAKARQQRAVHVERAAPRVPQQRHGQHVAVVEGEDEIRRQRARCASMSRSSTFAGVTQGRDCCAANSARLRVPAILVRDRPRG